MLSAIVEIRSGFVCPKWAIPYWDYRECTVEPTNEGGYAVVDHSIQTTVYLGSESECENFLQGQC